jgi:hypothetical protein
MASGASVSTASYLTKRLYLKGDLPSELAKRDHPLFGKMVRKSCYFGSDAFYSWKHTNPQSISGSFANAKTQSETATSSPKGMQLRMTDATKYGRITVDGKSMLKTKNNDAAFAKLWRQASEGEFEEFGNRLAFNMFRDGSGVRGQRSSESNDITTLVLADDARNFEIDAVIIASDNADGSSPHGGTALIESVNLVNGTIGFDTSDIASLGDNDYLFYQGEVGAAANPDGLATHFPLTTPAGSEDFRGVDRSVYPERLAGYRVDNTAAPIEENLGRCAIGIRKNGGKADCAFLAPENVWAVVRRLGAKVEYEDFGGTVKYGYQYVSIITPAGVLKVYMDPDCPTNRGYVCREGDLFLAHADPVVHVIQDDGRMTLRQDSDDGIEQRWRSVTQTYVLRPRDHGVISI